MELPNTYDPKVSEIKWQKYWEKEQIYKFEKNNTEKRLFVIDTPPPTVSGEMHLGHAFSYSQQDFVARYHRMKGKNVFYPFGTDDNGLATERLVEKINKVKSII
jgi:valyl-tRNA synthetase